MTGSVSHVGPFLVEVRKPPEPGTYCYLCGECGTVAPAESWEMFKRDLDTGELVPVEKGDSDPILRCPACGEDHADGDYGPALWDGDYPEILTLRAEVAEDHAEIWEDAAAKRKPVGVVSKRAAVDLEKARDVCRAVVYDNFGPESLSDRALVRSAYLQILVLKPEGGKVDLPDGSVIEVRPTTGAELWREMPGDVRPPASDSLIAATEEIVTAYNAWRGSVSLGGES